MDPQKNHTLVAKKKKIITFSQQLQDPLKLINNL